MDTRSELRLTTVWPPLADKVRELARQLAAEDIAIVVVQGLRTYAEQDVLYAQGRTTPGKIVTNAPGGHSWHNFGLAVDCAPKNPYHGIDWNPNHPRWKRMEALGVALGLTSGASWVRLVDAPHFQVTGPWPASAPPDEVRALFTSGGLPAVWDALSRWFKAQAPSIEVE